ncbi:hypothetical protein WJX72_011996 [[Myrmecia] bisecta]|uniref:Glutaredoxin-like protein n=1 Tax=[Myrmecia] bisecta TaxID=41462 RepID=A0AAW1PTY4_9CHLO
MVDPKENLPRGLGSSTGGDTPASPGFKLIIYSKPGCHLCDGLKEKVQALLDRAQFMPSVFSSAHLEVRDITTKPEWESAYGLVIPVLTSACLDDSQEVKIPRPSPRLTAERLGRHIEQALAEAGFHTG